MMKRADGARITYDGLEKMYHALKADLEATEIERDAANELYDRCLTRNAEWAERCGKLEAALREIMAVTFSQDSAHKIAARALTPQETAVNPTMQHAPDCPILHGKECLCDPYPITSDRGEKP